MAPQRLQVVHALRVAHRTQAVPNVTGWVRATSAAGYQDDFEAANLSSEAAYFSDMARASPRLGLR